MRIQWAAENGVKLAFTSLHIPEESGELAALAKKLLKTANHYGIEVYADVSGKTPGHLGLRSLHDLESLGIAGLRLDDFFEHSTIIKLASQYKIALNASIIFEEDLLALLNSGLAADQLIAWHNFYPRRETGLDETFFKEQNNLFKRFGIPVSAYIPGDGEKRGPLFEGLPTLEKHRSINSFEAALELYQLGVEHVYAGDPEVTRELLLKLVNLDVNKVVPIRTTGKLEGDYRLRPDFSRDVFRLMGTRSSEPIAPDNTIVRPAGTVTMDNDDYGRYRGEVQITRNDLPADDRVNVIGRVMDEDIPLLSYIQPGQIIKFIPSS